MKRNTKGFTLIELLIVVVIIGILAAIAIPKFSNTKEKAYLAAMKTDLRNLATAEEGYASNSSGTYFSGAATQATPVQGYSPSANVTVTIAISGKGWSAVATHAQTGKKCAMSVNADAIPAPATNDGEPACES